MKKILLSTTAAALLGLVGAASAADLGARAPVKSAVAPVAVAPVATWSGCYVGLHAGWGSSDAQDNTLPGAVATSDIGSFPFIVADAGDPIVFGFGGGFSDSGFIGGAQLGCDHQYGNGFVLGLVGDITWGGLKESQGSFQIQPIEDPTATAPETATFEVDYFGTARARVGFVTPLFGSNSLIYATGGIAWARTSYDFRGEVFNPATVSFAVSDNAYHFGWSAGLGIDWMIAPNWTFGLEYLHLDLGDANYNFGNSFPNVTTAVSLGRPVNVDLDMDIFRATLNYRF